MKLPTTTAAAMIASLALFAAPAVYAKAHDSGVSDMDSPPKGGRADLTAGESTSTTAQTLGGPAMGEAISEAARAGEPGFSAGKGTFGDDEPGAK